MYEPKIVAFLCTWCSYTGADTAGIARLKYPSNLRAIRVPCSGRLSPEIIMRTFDQGADGVLVLGCHIGECHYDSGNHRTAKRIPALRALMEFVGLEPQRLGLDWVSASEGERFARIVNEFTEGVRALGPIHWRVTEEVHALGELFPELTKEGEVFYPTARQEHLDAKAQALRNKARELLVSDQVECVIGYEVSPRGQTRPVFVYEPEEADRLVWNQACTHNLTTYLSDRFRHARMGRGNQNPKSVAVVAKPCDSPAINVLLAENHILRDKVYVIGVACDGIFEKPHATNAPGQLSMQSRCQFCNERVPRVYDYLVGESEQEAILVSETVHEQDAYLESLTPSQRMEFWLSQFDRCIRCYACRQACPMCNCPSCLYERDDSLWVGMGIGVNE
jgi:coenzyme F420-reducing hydrogenase delta subunit